MCASLFVLELLDNEIGQVLHRWELDVGVAYQLGRSNECDIVLANPYVSRAHALLQFSADEWQISAISRGGLFLNGRRADSIQLVDGVEFRIAERGPSLRFRGSSSEDQIGETDTMSFDPQTMPILVLDHQQLDREGASIAEGDFFRNLKERATQIRTKTAAPSSPSQRQDK